MADLKVIANSAYRNYSTHLRNHWHIYEVREDEGNYGNNADHLLEKMKILLGLSLWPQIPDGVYLNAKETEDLYKLAQGIQGLIHILNRSMHLRGVARDHEPGQELWLGEHAESQIWCGLIELSKQLAKISEKSLRLVDETRDARH